MELMAESQMNFPLDSICVSGNFQKIPNSGTNPEKDRAPELRVQLPSNGARIALRAG